MSIDFNMIEKKTVNYPLSRIKEKLDINFQDLADKSDLISDFNEKDQNIFEIKTKKKIILKKELYLQTTLKYIINMKEGLVSIKSENTDLDNLFIDCKLRAIKEDNESTIIAIKFEGSVDFGLPNFLNNQIKKYVDKEIESFMMNTLKAFELKEVV